MPEKLEIVSEKDTKTFTREDLCKISAELISRFFDEAPDEISPDTKAIIKMTLCLFSGSFIGTLFDKEH